MLALDFSLSASDVALHLGLFALDSGLLAGKIALHLGVFAFDSGLFARNFALYFGYFFAVALCTGYESVAFWVDVGFDQALVIASFVIVSSPGLYYGAYGEGVSACAFVVGKFICASQWS